MRNFLHFKKAFHVALFCVLLLAAGLTNADAQTGAINGVFAVGENSSVVFSQGNLQYIGSASTPYWKFADHQWDYLGDNGQGSTSQTVDRDLFGWGTSGYNHGANCYQPWSTSQTESDYYAYSYFGYNLYDQTGQADWGYNAISNGGNITNIWRSLTGGQDGEWHYLFYTRNASTVNGEENARFARAKVNNVSGFVLFPDNYMHPSGAADPVNINNPFANFNSNVWLNTAWTAMEEAGAVFLPAAGGRVGTLVFYLGDHGHYWSSSYGDSNDAFYLRFDSANLDTYYDYFRYYGFSVRLVCPCQ